MWICSHCSIKLDNDLQQCWNCGTTITGERDPDFVPETDVETVPADWVPLIRCKSCGYRGKVLLKRVGYRGWMWLLPFLAFPAAPILIPAFMIIANARVRRCPQCNADKELTESVDPPSTEADQLWQAAASADEEQFRQNKLRMLLLVGIVLTLVLTALYFVRGRPA